MDSMFMCPNEENDRFPSLDSPQFFEEDKMINDMINDMDPFLPLFPSALSFNIDGFYPLTEPPPQLFGDLCVTSDYIHYTKPFFSTIHLGYDDLLANMNKQIIKKTPKKRGRPKKSKSPPVVVEPVPIPAPVVEKPTAPVVKPIQIPVPSVESPNNVDRKKKKRKCMTDNEKAQHNHLERERRKSMTKLLETLRELVPAVQDDKKASQKKIVDEATIYLKAEIPAFLSYMKEKQRFIRLERKRRQLEKSLASEGVLCVWEDRQNMSATAINNLVKKEARENLGAQEVDDTIRILEIAPRKKAFIASASPSSSDSSSSVDSDEEHVNIEEV